MTRSGRGVGAFGGSDGREGRGIIGGSPRGVSPRGMRGGSGSERGSARPPIGSGEKTASGSLRRSGGSGGCRRGSSGKGGGGGGGGGPGRGGAAGGGHFPRG